MKFHERFQRYNGAARPLERCETGLDRRKERVSLSQISFVRIFWNFYLTESLDTSPRRRRLFVVKDGQEISNESREVVLHLERLLTCFMQRNARLFL